jgi:hypothetical protein
MENNEALTSLKERSLSEGSATGMVITINIQSLSVILATMDFEDHLIIEKVGTGEAKAVVAAGLGESGLWGLGFGHSTSNNRTDVLYYTLL